MPRLLDLACSRCGAEVDDFFVMSVPQRIIHLNCNGIFEPVYRVRKRAPAQWSDRDSITIFRKPDGSLSYPARNDKPTPSNCERITIKTLSELRAFERSTNTISHIGNYDKSGRSIDDGLPEFKHSKSERDRYERFRESTRGLF